MYFTTFMSPAYAEYTLHNKQRAAMCPSLCTTKLTSHHYRRSPTFPQPIAFHTFQYTFVYTYCSVFTYLSHSLKPNDITVACLDTYINPDTHTPHIDALQSVNIAGSKITIRYTNILIPQAPFWKKSLTCLQKGKVSVHLDLFETHLCENHLS